MDELDASNPEAMRLFYKQLFPWKQLFTWLNHEQGVSFFLIPSILSLSNAHSFFVFFSLVPTRLFTHREFAFTLAGDIYLRYNSFATYEDMKREVLRLNPSRFEIGAVYTAKVPPASVVSSFCVVNQLN